MSHGSLSKPDHMSNEEYEEYKLSAEGANELTVIPDCDFEPPDDESDEEGPATYTCGGCGMEFTVPPYQDANKCPRKLIDDEICPDCAQLCEICQGEHRECKEIDLT